RPDAVDAPERDGRVRVVVKRAGVVPYRLRPPPVHRPAAGLGEYPGGVEREPEVRPLPHVDQPPGPVLELLPAEPPRDQVVPADGQVVRVPGAEGDVLQRVPEVGPPGRVLEQTPVLVVAEELVRRPPFRGGRDRPGDGLPSGPEPRLLGPFRGRAARPPGPAV